MATMIAAAGEVKQQVNSTAQVNITFNHNYNKILKCDWLSTVLISALIGQCNRTVRVMPVIGQSTRSYALA